MDVAATELEKRVTELTAAVRNERAARHTAEAELSDLRARVDNAQRLAHMGDYDWHIATDTNRWSDQLFRIYGYEPQAFHPSYERFLAHVHPDDRDRITAVHQHAYETGEPYEMIERIVRPDGEVRFLASNGQVVRDECGVPVRMRGTCLDVTERIVAEQARERLAARIHRLVESSPDAILLTDAGGSVVLANVGAHRLLGGDPVGTPADRISPRLLAGGHEILANGLDGRPLELDVTVARLCDADGDGLVAAYLRDATERQADEARAAALREAQVRHRQAQEINDDIVQGLTAAVLAMQRLDSADALHYVEQTLAAARRLMNDWTGEPFAADEPVRPGALVRACSSTTAPLEACPPRTGQPTAADFHPDRRILVVDDNATVRHLLCAQLERSGRGTVVGEAADGEEAIELATALQPDLVLLDLSMPRMDGLQALPRILEAVAGVKVIVMSGFDQRTLGEQVLAAGAATYVEKGLQMNLPAVIDAVYQAA
ncbi:response regulator [Sporichthya polymorpha]|uniref:response regulator n=1 Tax=Sporichthya polymorpha TaxID=35751 RepID=UPI00037EB170|nr:response regulator [Sporichthya polymorpha]